MRSQFTILNPCSRKWTELPVGEPSGDGRAHFCDRCQTHVHDFEKYSQAEWDRLWRESNGHVCGVLSPLPITEPRSRRAILAGALLTMASPLFAQSGRVRIRVMDVTGALIPNAKVSLLGDNDDQTLRTVASDAKGEATLLDLPAGNNKLRVAASGFQSLLLTVITLGGSEVTRDAVLVLQVSPFPMGVIVEAAPMETVKAPISSDLESPVKLKRKHWWTFWR